jgi:hypothetical protein
MLSDCIVTGKNHAINLKTGASANGMSYLKSWKSEL